MAKRVKLAGKSRVVFAVVDREDDRLVSVHAVRSKARSIVRLAVTAIVTDHGTRYSRRRPYRVQRGIFVPRGRA